MRGKIEVSCQRDTPAALLPRRGGEWELPYRGFQVALFISRVKYKKQSTELQL
jgi:hypothetical protein